MCSHIPDRVDRWFVITPIHGLRIEKYDSTVGTAQEGKEKTLLAHRLPPCPCGGSPCPADPGKRFPGVYTGRCAEKNFRLACPELRLFRLLLRVPPLRDGQRPHPCPGIHFPPAILQNGSIVRMKNTGAIHELPL
jgi:hypothetical protein